MKSFYDPAKIQKWCAAKRGQGLKIALVPTMGALHDGHLSLISAAKKAGADEIVVSVFVNPTQFGPNEDYAKYPRHAKADAATCRKAGATAIFFPTPDNMYAPNHSVWVVEDGALSDCLCGARRPGHFRGVCTVVAKLFNIVHPDIAIFGQKDYQQAAIIKRMVRDLNFDVEVLVAPIVRESSGLAMSSRNAYLSEEERKNALALSGSLLSVKKGPWAVQRRRIVKYLESHCLKVDYVEAVGADDLMPVKAISSGVVVLLAVYDGKTRLIDNRLFD
ncbi:MAG: pantoate--beta-alanine ligase [Kiritimatiellae bacterium]|nr:pantoate--beta-alanine ligase [Kiritimatiellia bacterium]